MKNMKIIIRRKISNHHINNDVERYVTIRRIADNADVEQIVILGHVEYFKDGVDVTSAYRSEIPDWIVGNHYNVSQRDENNDIVIDKETQEPVMIPAFDYHQSIILENKVPLLTLLEISIANDDEKGTFNF